MLRGSYAGGSLAVTARCPGRRSGPSAILHARVQAPRPARSPRGTLPDLVAGASSSIAWLDRAPAIHGFATPLRFSAYLCRRMARLSKAFAFHRRASCRHAIAAHRLGLLSTSVAPLRCADPLRRVLRYAVLFRCVAYFAMLRLSPALSRGASPQLLIAFQSHRPATRRKASPSLPVSVHRRCTPRLCFAVASRCFAPQCRGRSRRLMAELPNASASRLVAGPSRGRSLLCSAIAGPGFALLVRSIAIRGSAMHFLRRSMHCYANPLRRRPSQSLSAAVPSKSKRFLCNALHRSSIAEPLDAVLLLRDAEPGKSFAIRSCAIPPSRFLRYA